MWASRVWLSRPPSSADTSPRSALTLLLPGVVSSLLRFMVAGAPGPALSRRSRRGAHPPACQWGLRGLGSQKAPTGRGTRGPGEGPGDTCRPAWKELIGQQGADSAFSSPAGGLPGCIRAAQREEPRDGDKMGRWSKGQEGAQRMGEGETGWRETGRPGAPLSRAGPPSACCRTSVHSRVPKCLITMQQRKQQEMAQPHVFLHTAHPRTAAGSGRSLSMRMLWWGQDEVYVGEGVKHRQSGPFSSRNGSSPCQLQAEVTGLHFSQGTKLLENTMQNNSPAKLRSQGRVAPLWASSPAFPGHGTTGDAGNNTIPSHPS